MKAKKQYRIMVAEDDDGITDAIKIMLEMNGYQVKTTVDGQTVRDMKEELPDLLLLDIWMSGMDGRQICSYLKGKEDTKHIPIIIISAGRDVGKSAREAGADDFLAKPFDMDDLLRAVAKQLKK